MNMVVVAIICLIVLAVSLYIFGQKSNTFNKGTSTCGGECQATPQACEQAGTVPIYFPSCGGDQAMNYCCFRAGGG